MFKMLKSLTRNWRKKLSGLFYLMFPDVPFQLEICSPNMTVPIRPMWLDMTTCGGETFKALSDVWKIPAENMRITKLLQRKHSHCLDTVEDF